MELLEQPFLRRASEVDDHVAADYEMQPSAGSLPRKKITVLERHEIANLGDYRVFAVLQREVSLAYRWRGFEERLVVVAATARCRQCVTVDIASDDSQPVEAACIVNRQGVLAKQHRE